MNPVIKQIKKLYNIFTPRHKIIADYILENHEVLPELTARELAERTQSVPSSIISFSKKLGYKGFNELKFQYESDINSNTQLNQDLFDIFNRVDKLTKTKEFKEVLEILENTPKIFILASQMSQIPAKDFYFRMRKIEPSKMIFFESYNDQLRMSSLMEKSDVALIVSNSGEAQEIKNLQKELYKNGCKQILVTNSNNSTLSKYATVELSINYRESHPVLNQEVPTLSRYALLAILEKIFLYFLYKDFDKNIETIKHMSKLYNK
ncbi:MurR/RpiR family transcriptional regulator [Helcococcus kunzii]|uniref:HTH rpiR-type domain-containing protein n=2 Tax=Helcococcus kunzii TaxID=40091 RepID=H3NLQ4_9FIRM|nr:MurR/RpiR family transcriptional regulator [Helcococcus kunzii]EHR35739.1 hypothetical protein HMPREF9709_00265 [Helcococcus kunzii ATCC 51366]MCT1796278.1 MurR/RpiR family transcriptional regulator [Helcococcus kunzii]MCT1989136.1 MurR/RpiR family transcriptional regulator [Helcococcus kunzii]QUY64194.1 MurR/RpiR family transcriptional regulator [Helcococcus kunzii]